MTTSQSDQSGKSGQGPRPESARSEPGYRGALPTREDRLARPWIVTVAGIFMLIFALAFLGVPSRFFPEPADVPPPTLPASGSIAPSASVAPSASPSAEASPSGD